MSGLFNFEIQILNFKIQFPELRDFDFFHTIGLRFLLFWE